MMDTFQIVIFPGIQMIPMIDCGGHGKVAQVCLMYSQLGQSNVTRMTNLRFQIESSKPPLPHLPPLSLSTSHGLFLPAGRPRRPFLGTISISTTLISRCSRSVSMIYTSMAVYGRKTTSLSTQAISSHNIRMPLPMLQSLTMASTTSVWSLPTSLSCLQCSVPTRYITSFNKMVKQHLQKMVRTYIHNTLRSEAHQFDIKSQRSVEKVVKTKDGIREKKKGEPSPW